MYERSYICFDTAFKSWHSSFLTIISHNCVVVIIGGVPKTSWVGAVVKTQNIDAQILP